VYGARPLKRFLQRDLETKIGRSLIAGQISEGALIKVDFANGEMQVNIES
jgi:ATP-dependent Clp protease ATP-binding subunit ClpB